MCAQASDFGHRPDCQGLCLSGGAARLIYCRMLDSPVGLSGISQRRHGGLLKAQAMDGVGVCVCVCVCVQRGWWTAEIFHPLHLVERLYNTADLHRADTLKCDRYFWLYNI